VSKLTVFTGNANPDLALNIASSLKVLLGKATVSKFSDGETFVEIHENVRGADVFIIQSICAPANDSLMELLLLADALRRASAAKITAVIPYFGYARQDRRVRSARVPITAKVIADMLTAVGVNRVVTVDLHADQIQGFFYFPVDNVYASTLMLKDMISKNFNKPLIVSPDIGGVIRARAVAKRFTVSDLAIIDKRRAKPGEVEAMHVIGDVAGYVCIIIDDIVDTAGTLCMAVKALIEKGATQVIAYATHAVLSGNAVAAIAASELSELVVTDTIPLSDAAKNCSKIRQLSLSPLLALTIQKVTECESLSSMFTTETIAESDKS
jgi:ribose-phosphate pyrophosphokinase